MGKKNHTAQERIKMSEQIMGAYQWINSRHGDLGNGGNWFVCPNGSLVIIDPNQRKDESHPKDSYEVWKAVATARGNHLLKLIRVYLKKQPPPPPSKKRKTKDSMIYKYDSIN